MCVQPHAQQKNWVPLVLWCLLYKWNPFLQLFDGQSNKCTVIFWLIFDECTKAPTDSHYFTHHPRASKKLHQKF